jgi:Rps23 Pro-64 3,4-dihydroxylase Tpa1-like proline 4-hydroxylase
MNRGRTFAVNPALDPERLAQVYRRNGRIHIPSFLAEDGARLLYEHLRGREDWQLVSNRGEALYELDRAQQAALGQAKRLELERGLAEAASNSFQYLFENVRVPDDEPSRKARGELLDEFASFLSSEPVLGLIRAVSGKADIGFADAQATAYSPGHFLTAHDDDVGGKNRRAAYVFNLTPEWRVDWGGLLMFHSPDGHIAEAYGPKWNALNLFAVPQLHSVSLVTPGAKWRRYAVTGWMRARP